MYILILRYLFIIMKNIRCQIFAKEHSGKTTCKNSNKAIDFYRLFLFFIQEKKHPYGCFFDLL